MSKIFRKRLLPYLCLLFIVGIASCKKDNAVTSDKIELLSFGPTGAMHGDTLTFIGNNLNVVTEIAFTGQGAVVPQSGFIKQNNETILLIVPPQAEQGFVTLKTPQGDLVSKTKFNLEVAPTVSALTTEARPGENITITGEYLNWVTRVTFSRDKVVDTFISQSFNQIVVKVPGDAQTGSLKLNYSGTKPLDFETQQSLKVTLPQITALAPNPVLHQTDLTITGTNLDLTTQIKFQGVTAPVTTFVSKTATQIVVKVPASTQKGKVTLVAPSGVTTQSANDLDVVLPAITGLSPNPIDAEGNLTITGSNLNLVTGISFTGVPGAVTTFVSKTANQIVVKVPQGTLKGKLVFSVLNTTLVVESPQVLELNGGLPPLADFAFAIYTDGNQNGYQDWSYTEVHDFNSTANVRQGSKSIKAVYSGNGYQGITFHNGGTAPSTAGYTKLEFSVFADASLAGKKLQVVPNGAYGSASVQQVTLVGGEWTTYSITLASLGNPATLGEIVLQSAGFTGTVHIDHVGLR